MEAAELFRRITLIASGSRKLNHAFFGLNREFYGSGFMPLFIPVLAAGKLRRI